MQKKSRNAKKAKIGKNAKKGRNKKRQKMHVQSENSCKKKAKMHFQFRNLYKKKSKKEKNKAHSFGFFRFYIPCAFFYILKFKIFKAQNSCIKKTKMQKKVKQIFQN